MIIAKIPTQYVEKPWGYELWFANDITQNYCGKLLHIDAGQKFSMHFHLNKHETFYVLNGRVTLRALNFKTSEVITTIYVQGDAIVVPPFSPHQLEAHDGDVNIIEVSTYHRDEDSYRLWR